MFWVMRNTIQRGKGGRRRGFHRQNKHRQRVESHVRCIRNPYREERIRQSLDRVVKDGTFFTPESCSTFQLSLNINIAASNRQFKDDGLYARYAARAAAILPECSLKEAVLILNAFAKVRHWDPRVFSVASTTLKPRLVRCTCQGLVMLRKCCARNSDVMER